jgi:hypothetical protein
MIVLYNTRESFVEINEVFVVTRKSSVGVNKVFAGANKKRSGRYQRMVPFCQTSIRLRILSWMPIR